MNHAKILWLVAVGALAAGCGPTTGDDDDVACEAGLLPGDLVISEIMANPEGTDDGNEWFEIYNATDGTLDLTGLELTFTKKDGTAAKSHVMSQQIVESGGYLALGDVLPELKPSFIDYGYATDLGTFNNTAGVVALDCGDARVDDVTYDYGESSAPSGKSLELTGAMAPDYLANDVIGNWCDATDAHEYLTDNYGTPGEANEVCNVISPDTCTDGDTTRDIVVPVAGDLVITEYMSDPDGADGTLEWFEVLVKNPVDLNNLELGRATAASGPGDVETTIESAACLHVDAGSYLLFAGSDNPAENGNLPGTPQVLGFSLYNNDGGIFISHDGVVIDQITYPSSTAGVSASLDPDHLTATDNDDAAYWCAGRPLYYDDGAGHQDYGTPGVVNQDCIGAGECDDGGTVRAINSPLPADVTITEYIPNPNGTDTYHEWIEVHFAKAADLNGVTLGRINSTTEVSNTFASDLCLTVEAGEYVVFAKSLDPDINGGLPKADYELGSVNLTNTGTVDLYLEVDSTPLDTHSYSSTPPSGFSAALNAAGDTWCQAAAADTFGTNDPQDHGTPGAANVTVENCP